MNKEFKYNSIFANLQIKPLISEEKDKYLSLASIDNLKRFLPEIDTDKNIDLLPIAFDACVVNRVNKNGDVVNSLTASEMLKNFVNKPINVEHDRTKVVGCILTASFSKFGDNQIITEDEAKEMKEPYYITLGGVIWKIINPQLSNLIEESNDPSSENYMNVSASWELGFNEYDLVLLNDNNKNLEDGTFVSDEKEKDKLKKNLKSFGGSGKIDKETSIYRQVLGNVIPLGIGLTSNPAADVQGVAVKSNEDSSLFDPKSNDQEADSSNINKNNISQNEENNVNEEGVIKRIIMKIENINQITDELLKQVTASSVAEFIQDELKKASEAFVAEKSEKDTAIKAAQEKYESLSTESNKVKEELEKLKASLAQLEEEKAAKIKEEAFNVRMASLDEEYDLSDEDRQVLATDVKDLNDETFAAYKNKMAVLMKEKNKAAKKAAQEKMSKKDVKQDLQEDVKDKGVDENKEDKTGKMVKASVESTSEQSATEVVDEVLDNSNVEKNSIANSTITAEVSLREKYSKAFGFEGFDIK